MLASSFSGQSPPRRRRSRSPPPPRLVFEPIQTVIVTSKDEPSNSASSLSVATHRGTVVMLHGWAQNVHVFSNRAKKLTKRLNHAGYRVVFLQAPHRLPPKSTTPFKSNTSSHNHKSAPTCTNVACSTTTSREYAYAWFLYDMDAPAADNTTFVSVPSSTGYYRGMNESLNVLRNELYSLLSIDNKDQSCQESVQVVPPIYLLGFSQGAVLTHKVATLAFPNNNCVVPTALGGGVQPQQRATSSSTTTTHRDWNDIEKFILVSGFPCSARLDKQLDVKKTQVVTSPPVDWSVDASPSFNIKPSLHVLGRNDIRVLPWLTRQVYLEEECFQGQYVVWEHDRGHVLPTDRAFCDFLMDFLHRS